jgi:hypothetical protein
MAKTRKKTVPNLILVFENGKLAVAGSRIPKKRATKKRATKKRATKRTTKRATKR